MGGTPHGGRDTVRDPGGTLRGVGSAWAAVTLVNALSTGFGCAAAISLPVEVVAELRPRTDGAAKVELSPASDTPLVRSALLSAMRRFAPGVVADVSVSVRSSIPPARGLKSSSAVAVALGRAVAAAVERPIGTEEAARFASGVGSAAGLSATGAFDDAMASAGGGLVLTDNPEKSLLRHDPTPREWKVVLWIPPTPHEPSPHWLAAFRARAGEGRGAADAAREGRYFDAMRRNTELVESVLGYDYRSIRDGLRRYGALGSGVSGMGPTLAAIVLEGQRAAVARSLPVGRGDILSLEFAPPGSMPVSAGAS